MSEMAAVQAEVGVDLGGGREALEGCPEGEARARARAAVRARVVSIAALLLVLLLVSLGGLAAYRALTDAFVAPAILSPDSEAVLQTKLSVSRLESERQSLQGRVDEGVLAIEAATAAVSLLQKLQESVGDGVTWASTLASEQAANASADLGALRRQGQVLRATCQQQQAYVDTLQRSLAAGLVHRTDLERELAALARARVALLQNERDEARARALLQTAALTRSTLAAPAGAGLSTPEMQAHREQLTRLQVDLLRLEAERRGRETLVSADRAALGRLDELLAQLKARPLFRAIQSSQTVAFVPYKELGLVRTGAEVVQCRLWGFFGCRGVGRVAEVLPGEVTTQDPWGALDRGQYALLELSDASAAQARALRVRPSVEGPVLPARTLASGQP